MATDLSGQHLADLHALAAELGVERFRLLTRDELAEAILERDPEAAERLPAPSAGSGDEPPEADEGTGGEDTPSAVESRRQGSDGRGRRSRGDRGRRGERAEDADADAEPEAGEPVSGVLDITPRGHGFIRLAGLDAGDDDVYVSPSQIRRCELQRGDEVAGPARSARRGERYPALIHVDSINGAEPGSERPRLADATAVHPSRRISLATEGASAADAVLLRAIDLLAPLACGQRVLVRAAPGSGRTTLLRALARALASRDQLELVVLLIDERPEEVEGWREAAPGAELAIATADMRSGEQLRLVELAFGRAARRAEGGADVVLLVDSLSRIAFAADDPGRVKPIFGAGRETAEEGVGSLTIVATTLTDPDDGADSDVGRALETTETSLIVLDPALASAGVFPPIDVAACRVTGEEQLRDPAELAAIRALRGELAGLPAGEAAVELRARIEASPDNGALLGSLAPD